MSHDTEGEKEKKMLKVSSARQMMAQAEHQSLEATKLLRVLKGDREALSFVENWWFEGGFNRYATNEEANYRREREEEKETRDEEG